MLNTVAAFSLNGVYTPLTLQGTSNQVTVGSPAGGVITLSTPQNIHAGATPTFAGLMLSASAPGSIVATIQAAASQSQPLLQFNDSGAGAISWFDKNGIFTVKHTHVAIQASGSGQVIFIDLIGSGVLAIQNGSFSVLGSNGAAGTIFAANATANVYMGANGLNTFGGNTYYGLIYVTSNAGAPVDPPADTSTGLTPMFFDTTNNKLWAYMGAAWKSVVLS